LTKEWWHIVIEEPEDNKIVVLAVGTSETFTVSIALGGQSGPISVVGANDEWK